MKRDEVRVICTDKGTHPSRDLALVHWLPGEYQTEGFAVWDETIDERELTTETLAQSGRTANSGQWRTTTRKTRVTSTVRADGGLTFTIPACPVCHGPARSLRDDTLVRMRDTLAKLDVSRIP